MALLALFILFLLSILSLVLFLKPSSKKLPPGPFSWPIIGTQLPSPTMKPNLELFKLAQRYGPLMLFRFGFENVVVASNHVAAMEVLKNQDRVLSGRFKANSVRVKGYIEYSMVWADCTDYWKMVRKILRTELFSTKMLDVHAHVREEKVSELMKFLRRKEGEEVNFVDVIFGCILNMLGALIYSKDVYDFEDKTDINLGMKGMIRQLMILAATPNIADLYPIFFDGSDFQGLRKESAACVKRMSESWAAIINERRKNNDHTKNDLLQVLLDSGFSDPQIDAIFLETFGPGSDTSASTIEWALAELLRNPEKLVKLHEELDRVIGRNNTVKDSDLPNLPYLHACVKETLRLHPPVPFLIPHIALESCEVMNYTIPKGSEVLVNLYAIGRDPTTWDNPNSFLPERFLNSEVDYQGNHFQYIPFGAGRRMCPGMSLGTRVVRLILAALVHTFDWSLPGGMHQDELDMADRFGVGFQKETPLVVIPTLRK
ncbi:PREDICTED: probable (S)-N-methylcoclaurine 3'-hydroxylase isozyme 2 [Nelumbo nucifera]|uniref:Probable (S)-N-methylcoclaurine 3'-hydroxylase isozyme 2 n=1 Tax=Nelumbo nucifera TaxID=4432 RepID=A0A1U7ZZ46_NELNU|nr:PREDICTED: probable (S)-N-methylcoclaurine 3'-hydroxylase isozyme 2 [Nelumbo nucifera]WEE66562.1 bisbenzylisoquinoline synthase [Nelumbo nucifera]